MAVRKAVVRSIVIRNSVGVGSGCSVPYILVRVRFPEQLEARLEHRFSSSVSLVVIVGLPNTPRLMGQNRGRNHAMHVISSWNHAKTSSVDGSAKPQAVRWAEPQRRLHECKG
jgi:hypothetical protein